MRDWVTKYTCGSCAEFEYEGENTKGHCNRFGAYYYPDDSCRHWKEADNLSSGTSGCFITTACCVYKGFPDDCELLTTFREFRDEWLLKQPNGELIVSHYYRDAPAIVSAINALEPEERDSRYEKIYQELLEIRQLIDSGKYEEAKNQYQKMTMFLRLMYHPKYSNCSKSKEDHPYYIKTESGRIICDSSENE